MLERTPRPTVESPPSPELHRRGEREKQNLQPHHRDRRLEAEHHRQTTDENEHREHRREEEIDLRLPVLALAGILCLGPLSSDHTVAHPLDGLLQVPRLHPTREVRDGSPLISKIYVRFQDARRLTEGPLDSPNA